MRYSIKINIVVAVTLTLLIVPCSFAGEPRSKPFLPEIPQAWTQIFPEPTEYMGRDLSPTCIGLPGTDPAFSFFAKGGSVNNLVVFFDGGGGCWESMNTIYFPTCSQEVDETVEDLESAGGIFDTANPANPFKNWSFVAIPYCTGDTHWGSNDHDYPDYLEWFDDVTEITAHHRGFDNFLVVLKWITENFKRPHKIFVTGSSAGSYGAILGFPYIQETYPKSKVSILGDAGNGVVSEDFQNGYINNWGVQDNLPAWIPGFDRPIAEYDLDEMYKLIAAYYPHRKLAQYTTAWDDNQTFYYNVMLNINNPLAPSVWYYILPVWCDWHDQMIDFAYSAAEAPNYRYYIGSGEDHTIMGYDKFYVEDSAGIPFVDWVDAMVRNQGGTNGHGGMPWVNAECEECYDPLPCP